MDAADASGNEVRAGARILALLGEPPNCLLLHKLSQGPRRVAELRRETGVPPSATLRAHLEQLSEVGVVTLRKRNFLPRTREYALAGLPGQELRFVAATLAGWLARAPYAPLPPGSEAARAAVEALVDNWSATVLHAMAAGPVSLAELDRAIGSLSHSSVERRLMALRDTELVEAKPHGDGNTLYAVTEWLRQGVAPLAAAIRWERHHLPDETAPIAPLDAEAGFMLTAPMLRLPPELSGSCQLGVEFGDGRSSRLAGLTVVVEQGRVVSSTRRLDADPAGWASGPAAAWLRNAIEADPNHLELGGNQRLVRALLDGLNRALFGPASRPPSP